MLVDKGTIFIRNVYEMLAYAYQDLRPDGEDDLSGEEFERIHDLFAAILAKGLARQLKQGLHREYQGQEEDLEGLRGKIDMAGTIRLRLAKKRRIACEFDELSEDNLLNRIIKTTALLLLKHGDVSKERREELRRYMPFLADVEEIEASSIRWSEIRFTRNTRGYRMLIAACHLVIEGMLLTDERGDIRLMNYIKPQYMERLFEKFVLNYYAKKHPRLNAGNPQIRWMLDDGIGDLLPIMQSDIMLHRDGRYLIIDTKYYTHSLSYREEYGSHAVHSNNLYQIFTYVKNKEAELIKANVPHEVSGMLLYAGTDEALQPNNTYQMSGNSISVKTLDLNRDFSEISAQLDDIAREHALQENFSPRLR